MKTKQYRILNTLIAVCVSLLLASCDGGLFGTGDGVEIDPMDAGGDNTGTTQTPGTTGGTTDNTGGTTVEHTAGADNINSVSFQNMQPGGQSSIPRLRVLNVSPVDISIAANDDNNFFINALAPDQDTGLVDLPANTISLFVSDATDVNNPSVFHRFDPFSAAEFSVTTVIVREQLRVGAELAN